MAYGNGSSYGDAQVNQYATPAALGELRREPQILQQTARLEKHVEALHHAISELEARLSAVLTPVPPQAVGNQSTTPAHSVPLAQTVAMQAERVSAACQRLQELISRVEV
jgi:hypothetical protein